MKNTWRYALMIATGGLIVAACDAQSHGSAGTDTPEPTVKKLPWPVEMVYPSLTAGPVAGQLNADQIRQLERQAYAGDGHSASLLRENYNDIDRTHLDEVAKWERLAAENGDVGAATFQAIRYETLGGEANCLRAKFWMERAFAGLTPEERAEDTNLRLGLQLLAQDWEQCLRRRGPAESLLDP